MSLIVPFFQLLGYDVFNPLEFCPEYTADIGIKKGEKVDYAILMGKDPVILIEAKSVNKKLDRHSSQLFRYFVSTPAKFAILTNGIEYKFYTDLDDTNKMDKEPFLDINLLNIKDAEISQLNKFKKQNLNISEIMDSASLLKYNSLFKNFIENQFKNPTDDFIKLFLQPVYKGKWMMAGMSWELRIFATACPASSMTSLRIPACTLPRAYAPPSPLELVNVCPRIRLSHCSSASLIKSAWGSPLAPFTAS